MGPSLHFRTRSRPIADARDWQRRTKVWRIVTSPARWAKRLRSGNERISARLRQRPSVHSATAMVGVTLAILPAAYES
jgi:hypothetical protein